MSDGQKTATNDRLVSVIVDLHGRAPVAFHLPQEQLAVWNMDEKWAEERGYDTLWAGVIESFADNEILFDSVMLGSCGA